MSLELSLHAEANARISTLVTRTCRDLGRQPLMRGSLHQKQIDVNWDVEVCYEELCAVAKSRCVGSLSCPTLNPCCFNVGK